MDEINQTEETAPINSNRKMTREEIVRAVTEPVNEPQGKKKILVIPTLASEKVDFKEIAQGLNVEPDSKRYRILKLFCEEKNASLIDIKALIQRIEDLSSAQLAVLELICNQRSFNARTILKIIVLMKKTGEERLLLLRAFVDLEGLAPGPLNRFFTAVLPQGSLEDLGREAYEEQVKEKLITAEQVTVFYTVCSEVAGMTHGAAIAVLPKIRQLLPQHAQFINIFFKEGMVFGKKRITPENIASLINLFLSLSELKDIDRFRKLTRKLSKKPDEKKKDFQYLIHFFKEAIESQEGKNKGGLVSGIRSLFT